MNNAIRRLVHFIPALIISLGLSACGGGGGSEGVTSTPEPLPDLPPTAATVSIAATTDAKENGSVPGLFTLTLSTISDSATLVSYSVTGTATGGGTDYETLPGSITIPAGSTTATIPVSGIVNDSIIEGTETVIVTLNSTDHEFVDIAAGPNDTATVDILDNDSSNVNIDNPTLTELSNTPITQGATVNLVWSEEFAGDKLDPEKWFFETGDGSQYGIPGWGNNELQWYLPDSAQLDAGLLTITARRETQSGYDYTSARINTRDRLAFRYGRIEARMKLPAGQGVWPAFWLLPQDSVYGTWAASGEIDIMEAVNLGGSGGNTVYGTLHYGGQWPGNVFSGGEYIVASSATEDFHTYALEWDETTMRWYVDDVLYLTQDSWYSTSAPYPAPFDQSFYILLNVAVGGNFPGAPNATTEMPVTMEVDWIRVYSAGQ